jgi:heptosyltransferase-2
LLALFGPTTPRQVISDEEPNVVLWGGRELACRPCYNGRQFAACTNNLCMQGIGVAEVVHRAVEFVQGRLAAGAAQPV